MLKLLAALSLVLLPSVVEARDPLVPMQFQRLNPCPVTGKPYGRCPGYERDHIVPLCAQGADHPSNMQWLTIEQHRKKTVHDIQLCKWKRKFNKEKSNVYR